MAATRPGPEGGRPAGAARSGIVTLLTDFGAEDTFVGVMKGVLWARAPGLRAAIDLTHQVPPQDVELGAQHLAEAWSYFPPGTVHLVVVDPGVGSQRLPLVAEHGGHFFVGPDNGLLSAVLGAKDSVHHLVGARLGLAPPSRTFHGRDLFAPAAAALASGLAPGDLGPPVADWVRLPPTEPEMGGPGRLLGRIRRVDHFGNLISTVERRHLLALAGHPGGQFLVRVGELCLPLADTYASASPGAPLALINASDAVEIAVRDGNAALVLGLARGEPLELELLP